MGLYRLTGLGHTKIFALKEIYAGEKNKLDVGVNRDFIISVAVDKFSRGLQTHVGSMNRTPVMAMVSCFLGFSNN